MLQAQFTKDTLVARCLCQLYDLKKRYNVKRVSWEGKYQRIIAADGSFMSGYGKPLHWSSVLPSTLEERSGIAVVWVGEADASTRPEALV